MKTSGTLRFISGAFASVHSVFVVVNIVICFLPRRARSSRRRQKRNKLVHGAKSVGLRQKMFLMQSSWCIAASSVNSVFSVVTTAIELFNHEWHESHE